MAQLTDWQNIAIQIRDALAKFAENDSDLTALENFYNANSSGSVWTGLADGDLIGTSGITKEQLVSTIVFKQQLDLFLDNGAPAQGDYRATVEQVRSTD